MAASCNGSSAAVYVAAVGTWHHHKQRLAHALHQLTSTVPYPSSCKCITIIDLSSTVVATGSLDRTVRLWDLKYGMPLSISRPHGGTVRSVALDQQLVASGSSDNVVRLWHARNSTAGGNLFDPAAVSDAAGLLQDSNDSVGLAVGLMELDGPAGASALANASSNGLLMQRGGVPFTHGPHSVVTGEADESMFDLAMAAQQLRGHIGPVTSLCLTESCLYSGSWDYTVRCWRRGSWDCIRCDDLSSYPWV